MKIALCLPTRDGRPFFATAACLFRDQYRLIALGHDAHIVPVEGVGLPSFARNEMICAARALAPDIIVQIDDDTIWDGEALPRIIANMEKFPDRLRFCAVAIPYKLPGDLQWNVFWPERPQILSDAATNYIDVNLIGGAFTVIRASVFDEMEAYLTAIDPDYRYSHNGKPEPRVAFYECPKGWGEDTRFCQHWKDMGGSIWVDPEVDVEHVIAPNWGVKGRLGNWLRDRMAKDAAPSDDDVRKISILVPTRRNAAGAQRFVETTLAQARRPDLVEIVLGVDEDDFDSINALTTLKGGKYLPSDIAFADEAVRASVTIACAPRKATLGALYDGLYVFARGEIIGWGVDDVAFDGAGWDDSVRAFTVGSAISHPMMDGPGRENLACAPFTTRAMAEALREAQGGYVCPHWFPFWFNDVWFTDLAELIDQHRPMPWRITMPDGEGGTKGMRDLAFWARFYQALSGVRADAAAKLLGVEHDEAAVRDLHRRAAVMAERVSPMLDPKVIAHFEDRVTEAPNPRYATVKAAAEAWLAANKQEIAA
jgi:hypothetical protein